MDITRRTDETGKKDLISKYAGKTVVIKNQKQLDKYIQSVKPTPTGD